VLTLCTQSNNADVDVKSMHFTFKRTWVIPNCYLSNHGNKQALRDCSVQPTHLLDFVQEFTLKFVNTKQVSPVKL